MYRARSNAAGSGGGAADAGDALSSGTRSAAVARSHDARRERDILWRLGVVGTGPVHHIGASNGGKTRTVAVCAARRLPIAATKLHCCAGHTHCSLRCCPLVVVTAHNTPDCGFPKTRRAEKSSLLWKSRTAADLQRSSCAHIYSPTFSTAAAQLTRGCARAVHRPSTSSSTSAFECDETNSYCLPSVPDGVARRDVRSDMSDPPGMNKDDSASRIAGDGRFVSTPPCRRV